MAYSLDFRKKVLAYCEKTGSITEASVVFDISRNTIYQWLKLMETTGDLHHQVKGTKPRKIDREKLKNYLEAHPDAFLTVIQQLFITLSKLWDILEKKRAVPTMNKTLRK